MQPGEQGKWTYRGDESPQQQYAQSFDPQQPQPQIAQEQSVSWTASEFIAHHKDASWYGSILGGFLLVAVLIYFLTKDLLSVIFISVALLLFLVIAARKPQQRSYTVNEGGVTIDRKFYSYGSFKSFAVVNEGAFDSIMFMPLQRFAPELTIYFAPEDESRIINVIGAYLPNDQRTEKAVDRLMKKIRF